MKQDLFAFVVAAIVFVSGMAGLAYQAWDRRNEEGSETRDLINRLTGFVATMSALVLGLLIVSTNNFHNAQKAELETISARVLELDGVLRHYGPDAQSARDMLKELVTSSYKAVWQSEKMPSVEEAIERMDRFSLTLEALREEAPDSQKYPIIKAGDLATSINDQRLQISLQLNNSIPWPFMTILVAWASLLFFGFGMLARPNRVSVTGLAVGAVSVASAIFLILELSTPYSGLLRLSPTPILQTIAALNKQ